MKAPQDFIQISLPESADKADRQLPLYAGSSRSCYAQRCIASFHDCTRLAQERLPCRCQFHMVLVPLEQRYAYCFFKRPDLLGHGSLRYKAFFGGSCKIQQLRGIDEVFQLIQIHPLVSCRYLCFHFVITFTYYQFGFYHLSNEISSHIIKKTYFKFGFPNQYHYFYAGGNNYERRKNTLQDLSFRK